MMVWRAKSKLANHEAESAYVTGEGGAAENVMKFSEICGPGGGSICQPSECKASKLPLY